MQSSLFGTVGHCKPLIALVHVVSVRKLRAALLSQRSLCEGTWKPNVWPTSADNLRESAQSVEYRYESTHVLLYDRPTSTQTLGEPWNTSCPQTETFFPSARMGLPLLLYYSLAGEPTGSPLLTLMSPLSTGITIASTLT